jgi:amidohydrolase
MGARCRHDVSAVPRSRLCPDTPTKLPKSWRLGVRGSRVCGEWNNARVTFDPLLLADLGRSVKSLNDELVEFRRDLHRHPELGRCETHTTEAVSARLRQVGLEPRVLPLGTGLICDIPAGARAAGATGVHTAGNPATPRLVALRADIDALPVTDEKTVEYASTIPNVCHACGHDAHTAIVLGAGLALHEASLTSGLPNPVRLIFQPAEELIPGGSLDVIAAGGIDGVDSIYAVHCDPKLEVGRLGLRAGPITSAADLVRVRVAGPGGHTARPHLTADLVYALGMLITQLPAVLSRRVDPRSGLSLVWGKVHAGAATNAIPQNGEVEGTLRLLDQDVWEVLPDLVPELVKGLMSPYGVDAEVEVHRGVPPCVNDPQAIEQMQAAAVTLFGEQAVTGTDQSLGGEDFAWYLGRVQGALARLGVRPPGHAAVTDLHRGNFDIDERAIEIGAGFLAVCAIS